MALRRLLLVVVVVAAAVQPGLANPAISVLPGLPVAGLAVGFYNESCPQAEDLVLAEMQALVAQDKTIGPALLRFMFHDCLVRGCDASVMLTAWNKTATERGAVPSYGLRGFAEIEQIKAKVEEACPLTVSCADIIVMAARDAVYLCDGPRYDVETGRRDGKVSMEFDAKNDLPPPFSNIVDLKTYFSVKGLGWKDLVVLSGSHTIGRASCSTFASDRLYNYSGHGGQDPSLDKAYAAELRAHCEAGLDNDTSMVPMDPGSPYTFDLGYYRDVTSNKSLFLSDQALLDDRWTREYVERMAAAQSPDEFFADYVAAITNMGRIEVLTGDNGEIRKVCAAYVD